MESRARTRPSVTAIVPVVRPTPVDERYWTSVWDSQGRAMLARSWTGSNIYRITTRSEEECLFESPFAEGSPSFSADGEWLLYTSNESGQEDVYLRRWLDNGYAQQVSVGGGVSPMWPSDGREIYYWVTAQDGKRRR